MLKRMVTAAQSTAAAGNPSAPSEMSDSTITDTTQGSRMPRSSLAGVILSRRFAKRLSTKAAERRGLGSSAGLIHEKEPTYKMEPSKKFNACAAEKVIKMVLEERLSGTNYNPKLCSTLIKVLGEEIKDRVKLLGFDRYKLVCIIVLGQNSEQGMMASSRCTWDMNNDSFASHTYKNQQLICNASLYGLYRE